MVKKVTKAKAKKPGTKAVEEPKRMDLSKVSCKSPLSS